MTDDDDSSKGIFRVETVPPPEGDGDAYNAPTKVGPMASSVIQEMILAAQEAADRAYEATKDQEPSEQKETPAKHLAETSRPPPTEVEAEEPASERIEDEPVEEEPAPEVEALAVPAPHGDQMHALDEHIPIAASSMNGGNASFPPVAPSTSHPPSGASALEARALSVREPSPFVEEELAVTPRRSRVPLLLLCLAGVLGLAVIAYLFLRLNG